VRFVRTSAERPSNDLRRSVGGTDSQVRR
jgi:hypothetical protein